MQVYVWAETALYNNKDYLYRQKSSKNYKIFIVLSLFNVKQFKVTPVLVEKHHSTDSVNITITPVTQKSSGLNPEDSSLFIIP
jgi:hypothetical protein